MTFSIVIEDSELIDLLLNNNWQEEQGIFYRGIHLPDNFNLGKDYSENLRKFGDKYMLLYSWQYYSPDISEGGLKLNNSKGMVLMSKEEALNYCKVPIEKAYKIISDNKRYVKHYS